MGKFILNVRPKEYLHNVLRDCGVYTAKGILSAYGLDEHKDPLDYYSPNRLARFTGSTTPKVLRRILTQYGFEVKIGFAGGTNNKKIELLKSLIEKGAPVALLIGNAYTKKEGSLNLLARFLLHWITLLGYDDEEKVFYVYDSSIPIEKQDKTVPIGNRKIPYSQISRDWGAGFLSIFKSIYGQRYLYIEMKK